MGPLGLERRPGERGFRNNSLVDPLDLHRVDIVFASSSQEVVLWVAIQTSSITNGPSKSFMTFVILSMFGSAFFTNIMVSIRSLVCLIRVLSYAITEPFTGAFVVGLIVPRQGNLAIALTKKLEDVVSIGFLPLVSGPKPSRYHL